MSLIANSLALVLYERHNSATVQPYLQKVPKEIMQTIVDERFNDSIRLAKYEKDHLMVCPSSLDPQVVIQARSRRLYHVLPALKGPYSVGYTSLVIEGPKNEENLVCDRQVGVEIYAPTNKVSDNKIRINPEEYGNPRENIYFDKVLAPEQIQTLQTHSLEGLHLVGKMPVVIFSHGFGGDPTDYRVLLEEVASHGVIVLNLNHPSSSGYAPFSKESLEINGMPPGKEGDVEFMKEVARLASLQADNMQFVAGLIRKGELQELSSLGPLDQIILAGHSLGGAASVIASRKDPSISGCINLDGNLQGDEETKTEGLKQPVFTVLSEPFAETDENFEMQKKGRGEIELFHDRSLHSFKEEIRGSSHHDFALTFPLLFWLIGEKAPIEGALKVHAIASQKIVGFVNSIFDECQKIK